MLPKHTIYALCDFELLQSRNLTLLEYLQKIDPLDLVYIQYRDKINPLKIQKQNIQILKQKSTIPIIINDQFELLEYADGLHLGQEDLQEIAFKWHCSKKEAIQKIKSKFPKKILGLSTHNKAEILEANQFNIDYIGLGAYRNTTTKDVSCVLAEKISLLAKYSTHPVGAIGGVKRSDTIENISYLVIGSDLLKDF